jgi:CelD/BcsL family acetyltransferase involved in cellulose biosynthesis
MTTLLDIATIRDDAALAALEPEWWELWSACPAATPFHSPAWLLPWRRHFRDGELLTMTLHRDSRLAGLLPLFRYGGPPEPRLLPLGAGNTDYLGGLFHPDITPADLSALLARLSPRTPLDLPNLRPDAPLLNAPAPAGWTEERIAQAPCPILPLPSDLSRSMRQNLRTCHNRAERAGTLRFETAAAPDRVAPLLDALFLLHGARWAERGQSGVLADPRVEQFHRAAAPALAAAGLLRLHALHLEDRPIAVLYGLVAKERAYFYLSGFDPAFAPLGPGTLIIGYAIECADIEGAREFDFLSGAEAYKYRWGARDRPTWCRVLRPPSHHIEERSR